QRLRRTAEGLVARLGVDGPRADQADPDLRHQPGELGASRRVVRGALPGDVAAAGGAGAAAGAPMEGALGMSAADTAPVLFIEHLALRRGARIVLADVGLEVERGE